MRTILFPFQCSIAGVSWHQEAVTQAHVGAHVEVIEEPDNPYDTHARRVEVDGVVVGHLPRAVAARLADEGAGRLAGSVVDVYEVPGSSVRGMRVELDCVPAGAGEGSVTTRVGDPSCEVDTVCELAVGELEVSEPVTPRASVRVRASGRVLGEYLGEADGKVVVATGSGELSLPVGMVEVVDAACGALVESVA